MSKIFAKSKNQISLKQHIEDLLKTFNKIENKVPDKLREAIRISIILHDVGKVLPAFQIEYMKNKDYEPKNVTHNVPHSIFSIFWINEEKLKERINDEKLIEFIFSAVAYHHWNERIEKIVNGHDEDLKKVCEKVLEEWGKKLEGYLREELKSEEELIKLNNRLINGIIKGRSITNTRYAIPPYTMDYEPLRGGFKKDWVLISGFLQRCDHFASWCEEEGDNLENIEIEKPNQNEIEKNIVEEIKEKIKNIEKDKIWQIKKIKEIDGENTNLILIAPTGYGKTEFAFLWSKDEKLFYTLPIRSAVNQIYERAEKIFGENKERAEKIFGKNKVGLLHSDADVYLIEKNKEDETPLRVYELSRQLSFPAIISTGDQFFPYALRPPGYEKIFATFSYSRLVVDEVQAYDPKACAIIVKFIQWICQMGGKFLLMTATLPSFVKEKIKEIVGDGNYKEINIYEEEKERLRKIIKHKIKVIKIENKNNDFALDKEHYQSIINKAKENKRVLVILNTVEQAQKVYEKLKEETKQDNLNSRIWLLHSRFTWNDRREKETDLIEKEFIKLKPDDKREGKILVATQVVEASLDIDADVLFTEICPLDSLVQRMGRVLRRIGPLYEFEREEGSKRIYKNSLEDKEYEVDLNEPNVFIWVFENGLESGNGRVYKRELIELSHKKLTGKSQISEYEKYCLVKDFYDYEELKGDYLDDFYNTLEVLDAGWMSEKKAEAQRIFREIYDINVLPFEKLEDFVKDIKEFIEDIKKCVNKFGEEEFIKEFIKDIKEQSKKTFDCFKKEILSKYLKMLIEEKEKEKEGKKEEEEKERFECLIRSILEKLVNKLDEKKLEDLIKDKEKFIEEMKKIVNEESKRVFVCFKKNILSKYIVSMPYSEKDKLDVLSYKVLEGLWDKLDKGWEKILKRWLSGIYVVDKEYDSEIGLIKKKTEQKGETDVENMII